MGFARLQYSGLRPQFRPRLRLKDWAAKDKGRQDKMSQQDIYSPQGMVVVSCSDIMQWVMNDQHLGILCTGYDGDFIST